MNEGKHETNIQGDVHGLVQGDRPQVTMHFHRDALHQFLSPRDSLNRQRLLAKVRAFWIKGVLEQSLHGAALIALGLEERRDVLADPWRLVLQQEGQVERALPEGTRIVQAFDDSVGELLILGEPGAGKTTLLLELARTLLDRATQDEIHPVPVVFNLSSWAVKRQPIADWLVEELHSKYQVPRRLGRAWVEADEVLPLLDGLDEVALEERTECLDAINAYRQEHGLVPLVVCSRSDDYLALATRALLHSAVIVQPLSERQINEYLSSAGRELEAVRVALDQDATLRELATTPLMLSVLTLAYHGKSVSDLLAAGTPEMRRQQVFAHYVERMLERRGTKTRYKPQQTVQWLARLAGQLVHHSQTQFYIERMQPDWLPERWSRWLYYGMAVKPIDAPIGILVGMLIGGLLLNKYVGAVPGGLVGLLVSILIRRERADTQPSQTALRPWQKFIKVTHPIIGTIIGLLIGLGYEIIYEQGSGHRIGLSDVLLNALIGMVIGLVVGVLMSVRQAEIHPVEIVIWSWRRFFRVTHLRNGILIGLPIGLIYALVFSSDIGLIYGSFCAFTGWLLSGLLSGLSSDTLEDHRRAVPNQGIRRSARNSVLIGLIVGLAEGLTGGLSFGLSYALLIDSAKWVVGMIYGIVWGLGIGLLSWLLGGGDACIKHLILRLLLWVTRSIPWNYSCFLDHAAERILLRKVGGGYIFVHRFLLEYLASEEQRNQNAR